MVEHRGKSMLIVSTLTMNTGLAFGQDSNNREFPNRKVFQMLDGNKLIN